MPGPPPHTALPRAARRLRKIEGYPSVVRVLCSRLLSAISPEMALRLEGWLGVKHGGRADVWVAQQAVYDLWQARKVGVPKVRRAITVEA